ncbi:MAG: YicC/YloC family endoribonuclease [Candidatus Omnitrophota bacterium]
MIKSMTGYGAVKKLIKGGFVRAEIKTLNHRHFDISIKLPENCFVFENQIKDLIKSAIKRGRVNVSLFLETRDAKTPQAKIDFKTAAKYYQLLKNLQQKLKSSSPITLEQILSFPQVIIFEEKKEDLTECWPIIKKVVDSALAKVIYFRQTEGRIIYKDLKTRILSIDKIIKQIEKRSPEVIERYRKKIEKRMESIVKNVDKTKLETEVAVFAQNIDISEEITRIKGHLNEFLRNLGATEEVGKKLDFISQEISREINTLSAKANDYYISSNAIEIKSQIEKIREQLQNLE